MKVESAIKKIEKSLGIVVHRDNRSCFFSKNGYAGRFLISHYGDAQSFQYRRENDHSEPMEGYYEGFSVNNVMQLINAIQPPPPKFAEGDLIQGKNNKRAQREGVANCTGLVIKVWSDGQYDILWNDTGTINSYYHERDLKLIGE